MAVLPVARACLFLCAIVILFTCAFGEDNSRAATSAGTDGGSQSSSDKVYLRSITALTFSENGRASSRSGPGRSELLCVGGSASGLWLFANYFPHQVQCKNIGWDGASIQWSCEGHLDDSVEFGPDTQVKCLPYDENNAGDGYVLRDSCRLEYTLNFSTFHISFVHVVYGTFLKGLQKRERVISVPFTHLTVQ